MDKLHPYPFLIYTVQKDLFGFLRKIFPGGMHIKAIKPCQVIVNISKTDRFVRAGHLAAILSNAKFWIDDERKIELLDKAKSLAGGAHPQWMVKRKIIRL